jgi:trans-aconitate 2-methyltransferase
MSRDWDAATYDRVSSPLVKLATAVLDRLDLQGDETVLDAGCGSGNVTRMLLERLPQGHVIAVDGALSMVEHARAALDGRATVLQGDLTELVLEEPVDAVFSSAVFHWIADHDRLFERLFAALRPGGRIVAQCGGEGNVAAVRAAIDAVAEPALAGWAGPWNFQSPAATAARLERIGFSEVETWPQTVRVEPEDPREYLATVMLGSHLERIPPERHDAFVEAVLAAMPEPAIEYVRLNLRARRPL